MSFAKGTNEELKRGLKSRHLSMIAIGGAIGTGLFLSSGYTINQAGPGGALVAYGLMGLMVYFLMTSLGEMATYAPISGSFETYATKYVDPALGFAVGWNYWFNWAITLGVELVAGSIIMKYWFPHVHAVVWSIVFGIFLYLLNLLSAKAYGEAEYWFAGIKVVTIIIFLIVGVLMILGILGGHHVYGVANYVQHGGSFPKGFWPVLMVSFAAAYSFQGTELVGIAAGESEDPEKTVPKAINTVFWRILLFYMGAIFVLGAIIPWQQAGVEVSPFVMVFKRVGIPLADSVMNLVVLTSVLSCANSGLYAGSRMLWAMAKENKAPKIFAKVSTRKVPVAALTFTTAIGAFALLTGYYAASTVYVWLLSASGLAGLIAWAGIAISHYRFRKWYLEHGYKLSDLKYVAALYPFGPIFALILVIFVIIGQAFDPAARLSLYFGLPFFIAFYVYYKIRYKTRLVDLKEVE